MTNVAVQASMNKAWQQERAKAALDKPQDLGQGIATGISNLAMGVGEGVIGIVQEPIRGAQEAGVSGFAKGVGIGVVGAVLKPTVGVVDLVTKTTEGIKNSAANYSAAQRQRVRWPRYFPDPPILEVYNREKSLGQTLLKTINDGNYGHQRYRFHLQVSRDRWVLLSHNQFFVLDGPSVQALKLQRAVGTSGISQIKKMEAKNMPVLYITFEDSAKPPITLEIVKPKSADLLLQRLLLELKESRDKKATSYVIEKEKDVGVSSSSSAAAASSFFGDLSSSSSSSNMRRALINDSGSNELTPLLRNRVDQQSERCTCECTMM